MKKVLLLNILLSITLPFLAKANFSAISYLSFSVKDSLLRNDSVSIKSSNAIDNPVSYKCQDSMLFDMTNQKIYLYGVSEVNYEDINLKADHIDFNLKDNTVAAEGKKDSVGKDIGAPEFAQGEKKFNAKKILYNFDSQKGKISDVVTQEADGFIHGQTVKKDSSDNYYIKDGKYTTCNNTEHPHFYILAKQLKVIPQDKIITGPANLMIEGVPTPLAVPFGFFPNKKERSSGLLLPFPGQSNQFGFFVKDGGYYIGINDYVDLAIRGDIYTKGSWAVRTASNYNWRYKFNGNLGYNYSVFKYSEKGLKDHKTEGAYQINWTHNQDPKSNPNSRFTASVNYVSNKFNYYNARSANDVLTNTVNSNVAYTYNYKGKYNFGTNLRATQNNQTRLVEGSLPSMNFGVTRIYPFQRKKQVGGKKWYENIGISYNANADNKAKSADTSFFKKSTLMAAQKGVKHEVPVSTSIKMFKFFTLSPSFNYSERWYMESLQKSYIQSKTISGEKDSNYVLTDTLGGFNRVPGYNFRTEVTTRLYGMYQFKYGPIKAIRHVITPTFGFDISPQLYKPQEISAYPDSLKTGYNNYRYTPYDNSIYGVTNTIRSGNLTYNTINNIEMKVKSKKDTITGFKKIKLFEFIGINGYYNVFADSMNFSNINLSARTDFLGRMNLMLTSAFDPYVVTDRGLSLNKFEWNENGKIARLKNANLAVNCRLDNNKSKQKKKATKNVSQSEVDMINAYADEYIDFTVPWTLSLNYNILVNKPRRDTMNLTQTVGFNGDFSLTSKWKLGFTSGYDFISKKLSYTSMNVYRDLHCWELRFNWTPFGFQKSYSLDIAVKSGTLQDLKLSRRRGWYDLK